MRTCCIHGRSHSQAADEGIVRVHEAGTVRRAEHVSVSVLMNNSMPFRAAHENPVNAETCRQSDFQEGVSFASVERLKKDLMGADLERVA